MHPLLEKIARTKAPGQDHVLRRGQRTIQTDDTLNPPEPIPAPTKKASDK